ncbi:hypothetical protein pb186bvf_001184 [Paramecium bursaria]
MLLSTKPHHKGRICLSNYESSNTGASIASLKTLLKCNDEDLFQACSSYQLIAIKQKYDKIQLIRVKSELCKYIIEGSLQDQMPNMLKLAKDIIAYFELYEVFLEAPDLYPTLNSEQIKKGNNIPKQEENIEQLQLKLFECKIDVQDLRLKRKELVNKAEQKTDKNQIYRKGHRAPKSLYQNPRTQDKPSQNCNLSRLS